MWLSLISGYSVIRFAAIPLLVRSKTPLVFTFFDIFASTLKKNFNGEFNRHGYHGWALAMWTFRAFFSRVFSTPFRYQLINNCPRDATFTDTKKKAPVVLVGNRERRDAKGGRVVVVSLLFVSLSASLRPPFFRFVSLCILLSPHELYVLFVFLNRTIVPKSYQNQSVLVYITTSIYIYIQCMYTYSVSLRVNN